MLYNKAFWVSNKLSLPLTLFWTPPKQRSSGLVRRMNAPLHRCDYYLWGFRAWGCHLIQVLGSMARQYIVLLSAHIKAKVKSRLGFLYRNRSSFTPAAKLTLIQMTILPMLDYGDIIYRSAGKGCSRVARCSLPFGHQICHQCSL